MDIIRGQHYPCGCVFQIIHTCVQLMDTIYISENINLTLFSCCCYQYTIILCPNCKGSIIWNKYHSLYRLQTHYCRNYILRNYLMNLKNWNSLFALRFLNVPHINDLISSNTTHIYTLQHIQTGLYMLCNNSKKLRLLVAFLLNLCVSYSLGAKAFRFTKIIVIAYKLSFTVTVEYIYVCA